MKIKYIVTINRTRDVYMETKEDLFGFLLNATSLWDTTVVTKFSGTCFGPELVDYDDILIMVDKIEENNRRLGC